jgi:hypothetical protein
MAETKCVIIIGSRLKLIKGKAQRSTNITHVVANAIKDKTEWLSLLDDGDELLKIPLTRADEIARPRNDGHSPSARHPRHVRMFPKLRDFG